MTAAATCLTSPWKIARTGEVEQHVWGGLLAADHVEAHGHDAHGLPPLHEVALHRRAEEPHRAVHEVRLEVQLRHHLQTMHTEARSIGR